MPPPVGGVTPWNIFAVRSDESRMAVEKSYLPDAFWKYGRVLTSLASCVLKWKEFGTGPLPFFRRTVAKLSHDALTTYSMSLAMSSTSASTSDWIVQLATGPTCPMPRQRLAPFIVKPLSFSVQLPSVAMRLPRMVLSLFAYPFELLFRRWMKIWPVTGFGARFFHVVAVVLRATPTPWL